MKYRLALILCFLVLLASAQTEYPMAPQGFSKIRFAYIQRPELKIDEHFLSGSKEILEKSSFREKVQIKSVDGREYAVVPIASLTENDKDILIGMMSHQSFLITGVYDSKRQITNLNYSRPERSTDQLRATLYKLFGRTYGSKVNKSIKFNFKKGTIDYESGLVFGNSKFDISNNILRVDADNQSGIYKEKIGQTEFTNIAFTDENLLRYISPILPFSNTGGVTKIESRNYTIELLSVEYE